MYMITHSIYVKSVGCSHKIRIILAYTTADLQTISYTHCVVTFMIYLSTKFQCLLAGVDYLWPSNQIPKKMLAQSSYFHFASYPYRWQLPVGSLTVYNLRHSAAGPHRTADQVLASSVAICKPQADRVLQYDTF